METPASAQIPVAGGAASIGSKNTETLVSKQKRPLESALFWVFAACAAVTVFTTFGIIGVLLSDSIPFFREVSLVRFLTERQWAPLFEPPFYGVMSLVCGTFLVAAGAALFSLPMGLLAAIYLSEYASPRARNFLKPVLELLAGVPTVVYGYFALLFITPALQSLLERMTPFFQFITRNPDLYISIDVFNALSA